MCDHKKESDRFYLGLNINAYRLGKSKEKLCEDCRIKAQIELRDFINSSKYFKELSPFG